MWAAPGSPTQRNRIHRGHLHYCPHTVNNTQGLADSAASQQNHTHSHGAPSPARIGIPPPNRLLCEDRRSEEHTSELQSQSNLVCRLLLEKKKQRPPTAM